VGALPKLEHATDLRDVYEQGIALLRQARE
jgi:hypothetical protein